jgi:hypothetical protein
VLYVVKHNALLLMVMFYADRNAAVCAEIVLQSVVAERSQAGFLR